MKILRHLPNALTCCNLFCGCVGIVAVFHSDLILASVMIVLAGIFDFLDGFIARLLHVTSPIGKELDSLADMVTFGLLPSVIMFSFVQQAVPDLNSLWMSYLTFVIAVFSALRLAKFNIDTRQSESFIGVPTPANALLIGSFPLIQRFNPEYAAMFSNVPFLLTVSVVMSLLMVAEIPLFALKFKNFGWQSNQIKFIFLGLSVILLVLLKFVAVPLIVFLYVGLSVVNTIISKK